MYLISSSMSNLSASGLRLFDLSVEYASYLSGYICLLPPKPAFNLILFDLCSDIVKIRILISEPWHRWYLRFPKTFIRQCPIYLQCVPWECYLWGKKTDLDIHLPDFHLVCIPTSLDTCNIVWSHSCAVWTWSYRCVGNGFSLLIELVDNENWWYRCYECIPPC